jgi:arabinogalactan oligomer / maltooligosaccharide transport system substrate-binding protein
MKKSVKISLKRILPPIIFLIFVYFCTGCAAFPAIGKAQTETTTGMEEEKSLGLLLWGSYDDINENEGGWLISGCDAFAALHPSWKIKFSFAVCEPDDAADMVTEDVSAAADVYSFSDSQLERLVNGGALQPFSQDMRERASEICSQDMLDAVTFNGQLYGIPYTTSALVMYYDSSVFDAGDIDDLDKMMGIGCVSFKMSDPDIIAAFFTAFGAAKKNGNGKYYFDFSSSQASDAAKYLITVSRNACFMNDNDGTGFAGLRDGSVKAIFSDASYVDVARQALGDNFAAAALPGIKTFSSVEAMGINPDCTDVMAAWELLLYLSSDKEQEEHYNINSTVPSNKTLLADGNLKSDVLVIAQNEAFENSSVLFSDYDISSLELERLSKFGEGIAAGTINESNYEDELKKLEN